MKNLFSTLSILAIFTLVCFFQSCTQEEFHSVSTEETAVETDMLFNRIAVTIDKNGIFQFAEDKSKVRPIVEELFITKNKRVRHIDDFGFGTDELGVQYFYVKEITKKQRKSIYIFLNDKTHLAKANSVDAAECVNEDCCDDCIIHSSLGCTCHSTSRDCMDSNGTQGKCMMDYTSIAVEPIEEELGEVDGPN